MRSTPSGGEPGNNSAMARAVSSGRAALATPGRDQQPGGDQVQADQFHCGLAAGTSDTAGLSVNDDRSVLTRGTSAGRRAWLPSTA